MVPFAKVVYTRDRHPEGHCSFQAQGGPWPPHCIDGTPGFEFAADLPVVANPLIVDKGVLVDRDAYSGFDGTDLAELLRQAGIQRLAVAGLATDYCVKATVLDARGAGFETWALTDAIAAVDVSPGDGEKALLAMREVGAQLTDSGQFGTIHEHHPQPTALILVDVQNDFLPGGALGVAEAPRIFGPLHNLLRSQPQAPGASSPDEVVERSTTDQGTRIDDR